MTRSAGYPHQVSCACALPAWRISTGDPLRSSILPMIESTARELTPDEQTYVGAARGKAFTLYEGVLVPHRSCGIAIAETFGLPTRAYQVLRRGGITGKGPC